MLNNYYHHHHYYHSRPYQQKGIKDVYALYQLLMSSIFFCSVLPICLVSYSPYFMIEETSRYIELELLPISTHRKSTYLLLYISKCYLSRSDYQLYLFMPSLSSLKYLSLSLLGLRSLLNSSPYCLLSLLL